MIKFNEIKEYYEVFMKLCNKIENEQEISYQDISELYSLISMAEKLEKSADKDFQHLTEPQLNQAFEMLNQINQKNGYALLSKLTIIMEEKKKKILGGK